LKTLAKGASSGNIPPNVCYAQRRKKQNVVNVDGQSLWLLANGTPLSVSICSGLPYLLMAFSSNVILLYDMLWPSVADYIHEHGLYKPNIKP